MSDSKTEEPTIIVSEEHPLSSSFEENANKEDDLHDDESHYSDDDNTRNDPLQSSRIDVSAYSNNDLWGQQQESHLLDNEGRTNSGGRSPVMSPTQERSDPDTSHVKGFYNASDSSEIIDLEVSGQLPEWLVCEHFTIGPGTYDIRYTRKIELDGVLQSATATFTFGHWFDALPLANRFDLNGKRNTITYRNRLTTRRLIEKIRDHHGYAPPHPAGLFKTDSNQTMLVKFLKSAPKASKPENEPCGARILAGIPGVDGRLFAQNFANHIQELDPFDLKPTRVVTWDEVNPAFRGYSSCPNGQVDPKTGEYINFTMEIGYQSTYYHFFSISDRNPKGSVIASVSAPTGYVHSFSLTPKYIILVIYPLLANTAAVKFTWNESIMDSFSFYPSEPTLFYVISREKGDHLVTYRAEPCFSFNHVNAFEDEHGNVCVDMICYADDTIAHQLSTNNLRNPSEMKPPRLAASEVRRYMLPNIEEETINFMANNNTIMSSISNLSARISSVWSYFRGTTNNNNDVESFAYNASAPAGWYASYPVASFGKLVQASMELPQVNPIYKMHSYQFVYGLGFSSIEDGKIWDSIVKVDVKTKSVVATWHEENCYPSEAVFIPRPATGEELQEDDGVLLSVVMDSARATSFLLILDAKSLDVLARADLRTLIPLSFGRGSYRLRT